MTIAVYILYTIMVWWIGVSFNREISLKKNWKEYISQLLLDMLLLLVFILIITIM